ncbi:cytochrome C [Bacteroidota bacterium]
MLLFAQLQPVPRDIPLPLPMPEWILVILLIISFLAHLLFVNLMVGGTFTVMVSQILGLKDKRYDKLAKEIASTVTVNKSLAVVIGVAPLLIINTLYTVYFYSANALTGTAFISIIPLVTVAFLLLYYHKYRWEKFENKRKLHISILGAAFIIFLFIPLVFAANINLMQFPERWGDVSGFISSIFVHNAIPRYLHFVTGMIAVTGLFIVWYFGRKNYPFEERLPGFTRDDIKRKGFQLTFFITLSQLVWGPLLFFTFPWRGITWSLAYIIIAGVIFAIAAMILIWRETKREHPGKYLAVIILLITLTVGLMGWGRHTYRENVISPHKEMMQKK